MGYESKVIIARKYAYNKAYPITPEVIAEVNMSCAPNGFFELFDKEWDIGYYITETGAIIHEDKYGDTVKYAKLDKVLKWALNNNVEHYRRTTLLINTLVAVKQGWGDDKDLIVIHYGY